MRYLYSARHRDIILTKNLNIKISTKEGFSSKKKERLASLKMCIPPPSWKKTPLWTIFKFISKKCHLVFEDFILWFLSSKLYHNFYLKNKDIGEQLQFSWMVLITSLGKSRICYLITSPSNSNDL